MRRIRNVKGLREMVRETALSPKDFIFPLFIQEGQGIREEIPSLPGMFRFSVDCLKEEIEEIAELGIPSVILFGIPAHKDPTGSSAYDPQGPVQQAAAYIREHSDLMVITDVCLCEYTSHGHCGVLDSEGRVKNDETLPLLAKVALSHARAGAHVVAPSDMMDFRVDAIRKILDDHGYSHIPIMAYSAKYASAYYGPFRDAADSAPAFGDRKGYQMDFHNGDEALVETALDLEEDADFIIVKPALAYLDIIRRVKEEFNTHVVAYNVSGEYALLKHGVAAGIVNESVIYESLIAIKRAGAKNIITYFAKEVAKGIKDGKYDTV